MKSHCTLRLLSRAHLVCSSRCHIKDILDNLILLPTIYYAYYIIIIMDQLIKYTGSCHCGAVKYEVLAPSELIVCDCNCSVCTKKQDRHFCVPAENFKLLTGESQLTTYTFGTHKAKHTFCSKCGVQSFYTPRSDSNKRAIMPHCVDSPLPLKIVTEKFDGRNWEDAMKKKKEDL